MNIKTDKILLILLLFSFIGYFSGCGNSSDIDPDIEDIDDINDDTTYLDPSHVNQVKKIFINIPSPIEMATIMQQAGASYDAELLNSVDNIDKYTTIANSALNLGTYGADLSYTRMFDQIQESVNYLSVIRKLSDRLGIPQDEGSFAVGRIEENIDNRDSLLLIITETYATADTYLKENDRGSTAALIIMGGWIEALYISSHIIDRENPNKEIMNRVAEQKYSLENLVALMECYENDESISEFIPNLKTLRTAFDKIEIVQTDGPVNTDTVKKMTTIGGNTQINVTMENINEISSIVSSIREKVIN